MNIFKDVQGKELKVGQQVAMNDGWSVGVTVGTVEGFTPLRVKVIQDGRSHIKKDTDLCIINGGN